MAQAPAAADAARQGHQGAGAAKLDRGRNLPDHAGHKALEKLGYDGAADQGSGLSTAHVAVANGDATFMAVHWDPLHKDYYNNAGGDAKLMRTGQYAGPAAQGYLIDKATAEKYNITNIDQLRDPGLAKLFDHDGDGKADLTGCNPGWGCEAMIENHMDAYNCAPRSSTCRAAMRR
jgi:glycine betaine/proline transport system substrate-binding protein